MEPDQELAHALSIIRQVCASSVGTLPQHEQIQGALLVVERALQPAEVEAP